MLQDELLLPSVWTNLVSTFKYLRASPEIDSIQLSRTSESQVEAEIVLHKKSHRKLKVKLSEASHFIFKHHKEIEATAFTDISCLQERNC